MSVRGLHEFLGYVLTGTENVETNELVDDANVSLAFLDAGVGSVLQCFIE